MFRKLRRGKDGDSENTYTKYKAIDPMSQAALLTTVAITLIGGMMTEIKRHPWTTCSAIVALGLAFFLVATRAPASAVDALADQITAINITQLERYLLETRVAQCEATNQRFYTARLSELLQDYYKLTGRPYSLPTCGEVK